MAKTLTKSIFSDSEDDTVHVLQESNKGESNVLSESFINEFKSFVQGIRDQKFDYTIDVKKSEGVEREILNNLNDIINIYKDKMQWYESILDAIPFPISVTDKDMNWTFFNKAVSQITGLKREDMMGKQCNNWNADICRTEKCGIAMLKKGEPTSYFKQPGSDNNFQVDTAFLKNIKGETAGHIEVIQDISKQVKVKEYQDREVQRVMGQLDQLANGVIDFDVSVGDADDDTRAVQENFLKISNSMEAVQDAVKLLVSDAETLVTAAVEGHLDTRADASKHGGDFGKIVDGVNATLDAVIGPLNVAAEYVDRISKGDIPAKITDEYKGDFNEIKNNLNTCIDAVNGLVEDANMLAQAALDEKYETRADAERHEGDFKVIVEGVNNTLNSVANKLFFYEASLDAVPFPVSVTDMDMNWIFFNKAVAELTGLKKDEMMGKQCSNWNADICGTGKCGIQMLRKGEKTSYFKQPGQDMDFQVDTQFISNNKGEKLGHIEVIQDITAANRVKEFQEVEVNRLAQNLFKFADGDLNLDTNVKEADQYTVEERENFIRINDALGKTIEAMRNVTSIAQEIASGNLMVNVDVRSNEDELMAALKQMVNDLTTFASNTQAAASQVAAGSEEMSSSSQQMAQNANEQSASVEEVSSSMEEMNSSVLQNADNAKQTAAISEKAARDAQEGGSAVNETVKAMKSIAEKIAVIEDIAGQTNMLALNAAIEAARAGDHGKGFAVVASEVRNLAERSGNAAKEINNLSKSSVDVAEKAGKLIEEIVPQIQKTAELVQEINASSAEQANGIEQVTLAIGELDRGVQQNAAATEQMASTTEELSSQADQLQAAADFFKIDISKRSTSLYAGKSESRNKKQINTVSNDKKKVLTSESAENGNSFKRKGVKIEMDEEFEKY